MSHEIRTPMNGVLGMAQLLLAPSVGTEDRLDFARTIFNSGQTLLALLNDILDLSKVESGKFELEASVFEPEQIVHETLSLFAEAARSKGLRLEELSAGRSVARYRGDARRLRQMLANLVGNAIKFTAQGHVRVAVTEIGRGVEAAELEFSVSDTGPGVSPDQLGLLFKPFTQADSSNTRQFGGTGLGLSIVRSLSRLMGGDAGVDSQTGRGSRFWFRIRASVVATDENSRGVARRVQTRKPTPAGSPSAFSGHVLVAEDNPVNRKVIELMLTRLGLTVTCVGDGRQCVEAVRQGEAADLIFMDIQMPVLDGYQATRQIREWEVQQGGARRPIVALSAGAFESDRQQALAAGMDDFLTKPVIVEALSSALRHFLPVRGALLSEVTSSEAPAKDLDGQRFVTLVEEIVPLLSRQKFDAFSRYKDLQAMAAGSALSREIDEIGTILAAFQFDLARERLLNLAEKHAWKLET
jgi:CheY-like chemotaxis protein